MRTCVSALYTDAVREWPRDMCLLKRALRALLKKIKTKQYFVC